MLGSRVSLSLVVTIMANWSPCRASAAQIVAKVMTENNRPVIVDGKLASIDKGSRSGINEGDALVVNRTGAQVGVAVGRVVAVFRDYSLVTIPLDRPGTTIQPDDLFVGELPDPNQVLIANQNGHSGRVHALPFSPDEKLLASGDTDGLVVIWSIGEHRRLYSIHAGVTTSGIEFSNDGNRLITASEDDHNNLKVWDLHTGRIITALYGHRERLSAISVSPTAPLLASASWDQTVKLWDLNSYRERCTCKLLPAELLRFSVAFSADGELVIAPVSGLARGDTGLIVYSEIRFWSTRDCHQTATIRVENHSTGKNSDEIESLAGGRTVNIQATGEENGRVLVWDPRTGHQIDQLLLKDLVYSVSVTQAADMVGIGTLGGAVTLWNRVTRKEERIALERKSVRCVRISKTGKFMAWGGEDPSVSLFDLTAHQLLPPMTGKDESVERVVPVSASKTLATVGGDGGLRFWNLDTGQPQAFLPLPSHGSKRVSVSPTGVVMSVNDPVLESWDAVNSANIGPPQPQRVNLSSSGRTTTTLCSAEAPGGRYVALGDINGQVGLFDMQTRKHRFLNKPRGGMLDGVAVERIVFSADGRSLAWIDQSGNAELWAAPYTGRSKAWKHAGVASAIAFSTTGKWVASGGWDMKVIVQSTAPPDTGSYQLGEHWGFINDLAFSPDDSQLAVAAANSISIWNLKDKRLERVLDVETTSVESVAFLNTSGLLAAGQKDSTVMLWNAKTGARLGTFVGLDHSNWLAFTPDGFFDGTPAAWKTVPFQFRSDLLKLYEPEQFFNQFFQPGLLGDIVRNGRAMRAVLAARGDARSKLDLSVYRASHLPVVKIRQLNPNLAVLTNSATVALDATDGGSGVQDCRIFRNDSLVHFVHGVIPARGIQATVPLVAGTNVLKGYCFNRDGLKSKDDTTTARGRPSLRSARAFIIAVGVDTYSNPGFNLRYARADASDVATTLSQRFRLIGNFVPVPIVVPDGAATKVNIMAALSRLAGDTRPLPVGAPTELAQIERAQPDDLVLLFFAGHGMTVGDRYYLLPHDLGYMGPRTGRSPSQVASLQNHSISDQEVQGAFEKIGAGHNILIIDACESGQVLEMQDKRLGPMNSRGLAQLAYEKGMYVLAAAQSREAAIEAGGKYQHGLLTFALIEEGLKTRKAYRGPQMSKLTARDWLDYAVERVPQLQAGMMREEPQRNFVLAFVEGEDAERDPYKRNLQHPRVYYRNADTESPVIVSK